MDREKIFTTIKNNIYEVLEDSRNKEIREELLLQEIGFDSLEALEIISISMKQLDVKIPLRYVIEIKNIKQLVDLFEKYVDQKTPEVQPIE